MLFDFRWKFILLRILLCVGAFTLPYYISHHIFSTNYRCYMHIHNVFISNLELKPCFPENVFCGPRVWCFTHVFSAHCWVIWRLWIEKSLREVSCYGIFTKPYSQWQMQRRWRRRRWSARISQVSWNTFYASTLLHIESQSIKHVSQITLHKQERSIRLNQRTEKIKKTIRTKVVSNLFVSLHF